MVYSGEIYHPLRWLPVDAYQFLSDVPKLESAGIIVRAPTAWQAVPPVRGSGKHQRASALAAGKDALLDFSLRRFGDTSASVTPAE